MIQNKYHYMNPYIAGVLLGMVIIMAFYFSGHGPGASGAVKEVIVDKVVHIAPEYATESTYFSKYVGTNTSLLGKWMSLEVLGIILGGFLSGAFSGRLHFTIERSPNVTKRKRLVFALIGGVFMGVGSQFARGCTSGSALSGMSSLSLGGFVSFLAIFGTAFALAYFFRKIWI